MSKKHVVAFEFDYCGKYEGYSEEIDRLEKDGRFELKYLRTIDSKPSHEVAPEELKDVDYYIIMGHRLVNDATMEGNNLKWVGRFGAGFENVDIPACNRHNVILSNAPGGLRESVAETALAFIMALNMRMTFFNTYIREKQFAGKNAFTTYYVQGRTLGLLASGGIAQRLVELVAPMGMKVQAYDPYADEKKMAAKGIKLVSLEEVLKTSDYVSCHMPLTAGTTGMLTEEHFKMMKPSAFFINTSRGGIYDDAVLAKILNDGVIAGAATDVFEEEPVPADNPLLACDNAICTPHVAGAANNVDAVCAVARSLVDSLIKMADGELPDSIVNPEVLKNDIPEDKVTSSFKPDA